MAGILVLSDILKGLNRLDKTSTPKGKEILDSSENADAVFAVILSGCINLNVDPKGQNHFIAGQVSEEKQSLGNPVQSERNLDGQGSTLGYGNFMLTFLTQPMLQSDFPAGKEANSGNNVSQGTENSSTAISALIDEPVVSGNNIELARWNLFSQASDEVSALSGMTTQKPQGDNPPITELDKYKQVIVDLLTLLSGEITLAASRSTPLSSESAHNSVQISQISNGMIQSVFPVDMKANSRSNVSQGTEKSLTAISSLTDEPVISGNNLGLAMLNLVSQASDEVSEQLGMTSAKPQGDNPVITKFDKYEQVIADLLVALSGEITAPSPKGDLLGSESAGTKDLTREMAKIVQGGITLANDITLHDFGTNAQKEILQSIDVLATGQRTATPELNAKVSSLLVALYSILSQGAENTKAPQAVTETLPAEGDIVDPMAKGSLERFVKQLKGIDLDPVVTQVKESTLLTKVQQNTDGIGPRSTQTDGHAAVNDVQNQNSSAGVAVASNILAANVAEGKSVTVPVWEQISTVVREQTLDRHQALKALDIQLHPADLGKIHIAMRWENGQVYLQVQASEAATGQLLQNQLSDLRQALASQGVNCGMLQMGQGGEGQQNHRGDEHQRTLKQNILPDEDEIIFPVINPLSPEQDGINRINVTA